MPHGGLSIKRDLQATCKRGRTSNGIDSMLRSNSPTCQRSGRC